jgi:hypothetical protein
MDAAPALVKPFRRAELVDALTRLTT